MSEARAVQRWFRQSVTYEGAPYTIDIEQAAAVASSDLNAIVVARAGSGKTRTIVAKIIYLVAKCGIQPSEIMAFVFNANAAAEINARLAKMCVDGRTLMSEVKIASTFHAFARRVVYDICGGRNKCGKILAADKERFVMAIVQGMIRDPKWLNLVRWFIGGGVADDTTEEYAEDINGLGKTTRVEAAVTHATAIEEEELDKFAKMMTLFINRAQQKYLAGGCTLKKAVRQRMQCGDIDRREKIFIELGMECYRRYHWYLLDSEARKSLTSELSGYGTDFNLIVSWASRLISSRHEARGLLSSQKYILIDEYQDFSQLFLAVVLAMRKVMPSVRLFVVGDDWQAINRFAGSDVEYFKGFEHYFAPAKRYEITTNYRCSFTIVDSARKFMGHAMGEKGKFKAHVRRAGKVILANPRETQYEYTVGRGGIAQRDKIYHEMAHRMLGKPPKPATTQYIKTISKIIARNRRAKEILLLHRNNETDLEGIWLTRLASGLRWGLAKLGVMSESEFDTKVWAMTMHKSKGLEAEVVVILEADEGIIPKTHPDTRLYSIFGDTVEVSLDDQKRLFYVAMTRAKNRLYIVHDKTTGPGFVKYLGRGLEKWEA